MKRREIPTSHNFCGRTVLINGGATEVGKATIKKFLEAGAKVQVVEKDKGVLSELQKDYPAITAAAVNLDDEGVEVASATRSGPVHHLVNIVDIEAQPISPWKISQEVLYHYTRRYSNTYFQGVFSLINALGEVGAFNSMDGTVVNMVSVEMPKLCYVDATFYNAANVAILSINHFMATALKPAGIRVNTVLPTMMDASLVQIVSKEDFDIYGGHTIIKHPLTVEEKADLILSLSSPKSSLSSGHTVFVDRSSEESVSENLSLGSFSL